MILRSKLSVVLFALFILPGCTESSLFECNYDEINVVELDGTQLLASVIQVGCGATTRDVQWVVLYRQGQRPDYESSRIVSLEGQVEKLEWNGQRLAIHYQAERLFGEKGYFLGVTIEYVKVSRDG